jgi:PTS system N-acetylgalactosamine-specific IIB component
MPNILLTRIDNRLLHGQVAVTWSHFVNANLIVVVNDEVSKDVVQQNLMDMAAPKTMGTRYFSVQKTIDVIHKASDRQKIMLVVKNPQDVLKLAQNGVPIDKVNVGNMHFEEGKKQITSTVSVDDKDIEAFKGLDKLGIKSTIQRVPDEKATDIMTLI